MEDIDMDVQTEYLAESEDGWYSVFGGVGNR
jgi:hypothetical protein